MLPFAEVYYRAGDTVQANLIMKRVGQILAQNIDYYMSYDPSYRQYFQSDINTNMGMIRRISMIAKDNKQEKLAAEMDALFSTKLKSYK